MFKKITAVAILAFIALTAGCASVPMASKEQDASLKKFALPPADKAGLYIYRNMFVGQALKKTLTVDGVVIGETADETFFYKELTPGRHTLSTESEFSDNAITLQAEGGKNYYVEQYIKIGVFVGGANLRIVSEEEGKKEILQCGLAQ